MAERLRHGGRQKREFIEDDFRMWNDPDIYFTFETEAPLPTDTATFMRNAFTYISENTCLNYIEFTGAVPAAAGDSWLWIATNNTQ